MLLQRPAKRGALFNLNEMFEMKENLILVRKQHEKALNILKDNRGKLDELASYLYEHETITGEEFMQILNAA